MPEKNKNKWLPVTNSGKKALIFFAAVIFCNLVLTSFIQAPFYKNAVQNFPSGLTVTLLEFVLTLLGLFFSIKSVFKEKERAILIPIVFGLFCLLSFRYFLLLAKYFFPINNSIAKKY